MIFYSFRSLIIVFLILLTIVLLILLNTFSNFRSQERELSKIQRSRSALQTLEPALVNIQDFENNLNDLIVFKKDKYLVSYVEGKKKLQNDSALLIKNTKADPENIDKYHRLASLIHEIINFSAFIIPSHQTKSFDTTSNKWQNISSSGIISEFKTIVDNLEDGYRKTLTESYSLSSRLARKTFVFTGIISGLLILALIISFIVSYRDIFIRKKTEAQLKKFNEKLEREVNEKTAGYFALVDTVDGIVWEADAKTFQFSFVSKQAERLLGYPVEQWINEPTFWADHIHPDDKSWAVNYCIQSTQIKKPHEFEYRMITADDHIIWLRDIVTVIVEKDEAVQLRGIMIDITEHKKIEDQLRKSEERYRSVIEQASDAIMITDQKGNFIDVNTSFCKQFGYAKEELIGLNVAKVIEPEQLQTDPVRFDLLLAGQSIFRERRMMHKDGSIIEVEANVKMLPDGRILAIARDITFRKKAEEELQRSNNRFELITRTTNDALWEWDLETGELWANETHQQLYGLTISDPIPTAKMWAERIHPDDRSRMLKKQQETLESDDNVFISEYHFNVGQQNYIYIYDRCYIVRNNEGKAIRMMGSMIDITERKKAQDELEQSYKAIRQLTEHLQNVREEERITIAREIHDELGQQLTVLKMDISWLKKKLDKSDTQITKKLSDLLKMTDATIKSVRKISSELRPSLLDDLGLVATMEWQLKEFEKRSGIKTSLIAEETESELPGSIKTALFRIFQESLTNVARHAGAANLKVLLQHSNNNYILQITDDGKGFDMLKIAGKKTLGLLGMRERIAMTGGTYDIISTPGKGTTIVVTIPLSNNDGINN